MELNEFSGIITSLSKGLKKWAPDFTDRETLHLWFTAFQDIHVEELKRACRLAINTLEEFPSIKKLKGFCAGNILDEKQIGQDIADKIGQAIGKFGGYQPNLARDWLGELAWKVVLRHGGWSDLCDVPTMKALEFIKKEMKETAITIHQNYRAFGEEVTLKIPEKIDYERSTKLGEALKIAKGLAEGE